MNTAYIFPAGVKIEPGNADKATKITASAVEAEEHLHEVSASLRLRCPFYRCLAPLTLSHRGGRLYFAHKPKTAAKNCPHRVRTHSEDRRRIAQLTASLKNAQIQLEKARTKLAQLTQNTRRITAMPVLLLPLTQEMLDLRGDVREPWRVLSVIPEAGLTPLAPQVDLSVRPEVPGEMPGSATQSAPPESEHVH